MNPSSSTWISWLSIVVVGISGLLFLWLGLGSMLAGHRHQGRERDGTPGEQHVPVDPAEGELSEVVGAGLLQQVHRADDGEGVLAGQRFGVVVEVDQQRLFV